MNYGMDYQGDGGFGGGGGGGFGGGGFSGGYGGNSQPTPPASAGGNRQRRSYDEQTIQPVTISMILKAQPDGDSGLKLQDGRSLYHIKIVGAVRTFEDYSTNCVYTIEDGTGLVDVKQWSDVNDNAAQTEIRQKASKEHSYVVVIGQVKEFDGKKTVVADSVRPISTGNQITYHMLEVVYTGERHKRPVAPQGIGFGSPAPGYGAPLQMNNNNNTESKMLVLEYIQAESGKSEVGAQIHNIAARFPQMSEMDIRRVVDELSGEGLIYSTVDENAYCAVN